MSNNVRLHRAWILLLALVVRLINLGGRSLWYDEAFAVLFAGKGLNAMLYGTLTPVSGGAADIHPLLYYGTLNIWMILFGDSPFAVRFWSVMLGVTTVAAVYLLSFDLFDERTGAVAAFITAIAPFHVQYSQETRMYALLCLLLVLATWTFIRAWRAAADWKRSLKWWITFGILAALAMYTQQLAAFYLVALGLIPLVTRRRHQLIGIAVGTFVALLIYLPWLVNLPGQFAKVRSYYWLSPPNIAQPLLTARSFLVVNLDIPAPYSIVGFLGALFILLFLLVQVILYLRRRRQSDRKSLLLVLWLAAVPVVLMWLVSQIQPVYLERALLPSALMVYVALGWFFTRGGLPRPVATVIAVVGLVLVGIGLYFQYTWATFPNSPFQSAAAYVQAEWQSGDVLIHQNKLSALPSIYYAPDLVQRYLADTPGSSEDTLARPTQEALSLLADNCIQTASLGGQRVWWVMFDFAPEQYAAAGRPELAQALNRLDDHYTRSGDTHFSDLDVILFTNPRGDWTGDCEAP